MLLEVPKIDREGFVFNPQQRVSKKRPTTKQVGRIIADIGERAGVKVGTEEKWNHETNDWDSVPMYVKATGCVLHLQRDMHKMTSAYRTCRT